MSNTETNIPNDIWKDSNVISALKDGRPSWEIAVLNCPKCGRWGYYNEGSHFSCRFCRKTWFVTTEMADDAVTLADTVTETTDGYENQTLANPRN